MDNNSLNKFNLVCLILAVTGLIISAFSIFLEKAEIYIFSITISSPAIMLFFFTLPDCDWYSQFEFNKKNNSDKIN